MEMPPEAMEKIRKRLSNLRISINRSIGMSTYYLVPGLGTKRLQSLSVADVRRFLTRLERDTTAATAKESHRVLRTALRRLAARS